MSIQRAPNAHQTSKGIAHTRAACRFPRCVSPGTLQVCASRRSEPFRHFRASIPRRRRVTPYWQPSSLRAPRLPVSGEIMSRLRGHLLQRPRVQTVARVAGDDSNSEGGALLAESLVCTFAAAVPAYIFSPTCTPTRSKYAGRL